MILANKKTNRKRTEIHKIVYGLLTLSHYYTTFYDVLRRFSTLKPTDTEHEVVNKINKISFAMIFFVETIPFVIHNTDFTFKYCLTKQGFELETSFFKVIRNFPFKSPTFYKRLKVGIFSFLTPNLKGKKTHLN